MTSKNSPLYIYKIYKYKNRKISSIFFFFFFLCAMAMVNEIKNKKFYSPVEVLPFLTSPCLLHMQSGIGYVYSEFPGFLVSIPLISL